MRRFTGREFTTAYAAFVAVAVTFLTLRLPAAHDHRAIIAAQGFTILVAGLPLAALVAAHRSWRRNRKTPRR